MHFFAGILLNPVMQTKYTTRVQPTQMLLLTVFVLYFKLNVALAQDGNTFQYMLRSQRDSGSNFITLTCRDLQRFSNVPNASYFLNGSNVNNFNGFQRTQDGMGITVTITRELEGHYSCGTLNSQSDQKSFIGKLI